MSQEMDERKTRLQKQRNNGEEMEDGRELYLKFDCMKIVSLAYVAKFPD
jgi:hypothetical protein